MATANKHRERSHRSYRLKKSNLAFLPILSAARIRGSLAVPSKRVGTKKRNKRK